MNVIHQGNLSPWKKVSERGVKLTGRHMMAYTQWFQHPVSGVDYEFSQIEIGNYVVVMPFTATGNIILTDQWKQGVERCCPQFPGGAVGQRTWEDAASRILKRETGYEAESLTVCETRFNLLDSRCPNYYKIVMARGCQQGNRVESMDAAVVKVFEVTHDGLRDLIVKGEMEEPSIYAAVVMAQLAGLLKF